MLNSTEHNFILLIYRQDKNSFWEQENLKIHAYRYLNLA